MSRNSFIIVRNSFLDLSDNVEQSSSSANIVPVWRTAFFSFVDLKLAARLAAAAPCPCCLVHTYRRPASTASSSATRNVRPACAHDRSNRPCIVDDGHRCAAGLSPDRLRIRDAIAERGFAHLDFVERLFQAVQAISPLALDISRDDRNRPETAGDQGQDDDDDAAPRASKCSGRGGRIDAGSAA